jgi:collagen triple helix repeat protein
VLQRIAKPSPVLAVSVLAVVLAVSGSAVAASLITGKDVKDGSLTGRDIRNHSLTTSDLSTKTVKGLRGQRGVAGPAGKDGQSITGPQGPAGKDGQSVIGPQGPAGPKGETGAQGRPGADAAYHVTSLSDDLDVAAPAWAARNQAAIDDEGAVLGPFADGDQFAGIRSHALDGLRLRDIEQLAYAEKYEGGGANGGAAPYFLVVTEDADNNQHHVMFSPAANSASGGVAPVEDVWQRWAVTQGGVTYDDDGGNPTQSWDELVADHGDEHVTFIQVQAGAAGDGSAGSTSHVGAVTLEAVGERGLYSDYTFGH